MFGRNNSPLGVPGGAFVDASQLRPNVVGPMPNVTAGGTLWNHEKMMGPVTPAQFSAGASYITNGPGIGGGAPLGSVAGSGHSGSMSGAGFSGAFGRPAAVYGRRSYGAADTGKKKLQWWEVVFAPFTWFVSAGKGVYNDRGGDEGAALRQAGRIERQNTRVREKQERLTANVQAKADRQAAIQGRKTTLTDARATRIAAPKTVAPVASGASLLDSAGSAISDFAAGYMTTDAAGNLIPLDSGALQDQGYVDPGADLESTSSSSWPIVAVGGLAVLGIAYAASRSGKKTKSKGGA
jgi:hypothetical protein